MELNARLHLVTGKGGVGKTSVATALALAAARAGQRPLIVGMGQGGTAQRLGVQPISHEATQVIEGVWAVELAFEEALVSYLSDHLRIRAWAKRMVRGRAMRRFFWAAPGVGEVVMLHALHKLLADARWHPIIVDMDATGHAVMSWRVLDVFETLLSEGPLKRTLVQMTQRLRDPEYACMHLVTLPRALVIEETISLHRELRAPWATLIINRAPSAAWPAQTATLLETMGLWADARRHADAQADVQMAWQSYRRAERARTSIARLHDAIDLPSVCLPELGDGISGREAVELLSRALETAAGEELVPCPTS